MKAWDKVEIKLENGEIKEAIAPVIISASRSTDIPKYFTKWFINKLEKGYLVWVSPFNRKEQYVSFAKCRLVVFWTKDPSPIIKVLDTLDDKKIKYYFQYTLNNYDKEGLEPNVPRLKDRITTFKELSVKIGKKKTIWRFDPLILSDQLTIDILIDRISKIGEELKDYTKKLVISFADIDVYKKVQNNLKKKTDNYREFTEKEVKEFSRKLVELNNKLGLKITTCAEQYDLKEFEIEKNRCIDDELMVQEFGSDSELMKFIGYDSQMSLFDEKGDYQHNVRLKDKGQRKECGCIMSKDIGMYNTCYHLCAYCYANYSESSVKRNLDSHSPSNHSIVNNY